MKNIAKAIHNLPTVSRLLLGFASVVTIPMTASGTQAFEVSGALFKYPELGASYVIAEDGTRFKLTSDDFAECWEGTYQLVRSSPLALPDQPYLLLKTESCSRPYSPEQCAVFFRAQPMVHPETQQCVFAGDGCGVDRLALLGFEMKEGPCS